MAPVAAGAELVEHRRVPLVPDPVRAAVMALLEREHGVGPRDGRCTPWIGERLQRALATLAAARGCDLEATPDLLARDRSALAAVADALRVGETRFYRDPAQWEALRAWLRSRAVSRAAAPGTHAGGAARACGVSTLRGLSVGCSTGEEAYTLAMILEEARSGGSVGGWSVLGVDRSADAIAAARRAEYACADTRALPAELAARGLELGDATARISESIRRRTRFVERDATHGLPPGAYETVVCRNVLIYFGDAGGAKLVAALLRAVAPGGLLLVARSEVPRLRALGARSVELGAGVTAFAGPDR